MLKQAIVALTMLGLAGCGGASSTGGSSTRTATSRAVAPAVTSTSTTAAAGALGQPIGLTDTQGLSATAALLGVRHEPRPTGAIGKPPANGEYLVLDIRFRVASGQLPYNANFFRYQASDGRTFSYGDGNAVTAGYQPALTDGELGAGQSARGYLTFDAPRGGGTLELVAGNGRIIGTWAVPAVNASAG